MIKNWVETDRQYVSRSAQELDQYLSSEVLLWRMSRVEIPLSPGNLLLSLRRLDAIHYIGDAQSRESITEMIEKRRTAWEKKVNNELPMRATQWTELIRDYRRYGKLDASYQYNVRTRVVITLLMSETRYPQVELDRQINQADEELRIMTISGEFLWDAQLIPAFPRQTYPYLYLQAAERS
jgi:hypothetical protein